MHAAYPDGQTVGEAGGVPDTTDVADPGGDPETDAVALDAGLSEPVGATLIAGGAVLETTGVDSLRTATLRLVMVTLDTPSSLASQE